MALIGPWSLGSASTSTNHGGVVTDFPSIAEPLGITSGITAGSDGALWFTNSSNNSIGRITTTGSVSNYTGTGIDEPLGITAGADGALWFTNYAKGAPNGSTLGIVVRPVQVAGSGPPTPPGT